ncbi:Hypp1144 [Branchiostoma lanceolatum]|uniref:Hypp1144 protein n=1 Tax=Branchiostoma lanceolatum TaxID=7740 RepID=A0A8J9ZGN5_BRALA|nr:Hypp1144 [Branchiostoma lanceolatum]
MTKPKTCTVCQLPVRGHRGPHGRGKCGVDLSSTADTDSDRPRLEDKVRRSLRKLKGDSKVRDYAKGLWSEASASDEEHPPTVKDLREKEALTSNVDKTLEEIFGQKSPDSSRKTSRRDTTLRSQSRSRDADRTLRFPSRSRDADRTLRFPSRSRDADRTLRFPSRSRDADRTLRFPSRSRDAD